MRFDHHRFKYVIGCIDQQAVQVHWRAPDGNCWKPGMCKQVPEGMKPLEAANILRAYIMYEINFSRLTELLPR